MQFDLGTAVHTSDGKKAGTVDRIILEGTGGAVLGVVVHKGLLFTRDLLVPRTQIASLDAAGLHLALDAAAVERLPDFIEDEYALPDAGGEPPASYTMGGVMFPMGVEPGVAPLLVGEHTLLAAGAADIARGYNVVCSDGEAGMVADVVVEERGATLAYVVLEGADGLDGARVPASLIERVENEVVTLNCTLTGLRSAVAGSERG